MQTILIIDDDRDICLLLKRFLTRHNYDVIEAYSGKKALELLEETEPSLVMCDFRLEDMEGNTLLGKIKEKYLHLPVIIMTGYSDIKIAVEVMKMGAFDYITKPLFPDEILVTIKKALEAPAEDREHVRQDRTSSSSASVSRPKNEAPAATADTNKPNIIHSGDYIFGDSTVFKQLIQQIDLVAPTNYSVIIYGETIWDPLVLAGKFESKMLITIAMIAVALSTLATNIAANIVSPANDFSNLSPRKINFRMGGYITGILGILICPWKLIADPNGYIFTWLIAYSSLLGPVGGIMIADYYFLKRQELNVEDLYRSAGMYSYSNGFNMRAIIALLLGILPNLPGFLV
ncbi:MAG: response regulator, partial [Chitinophagaceae bacterium]